MALVRAQPSDRRIALSKRGYLGFAVLALLIALAGFSRTFFAPLAAGTFHRPYFVYLHGGILFAWVCFLLLQVTLIARHRRLIHMTIGWVGAALALAVPASGLVVALWASARDLRSTSDSSPIAFLLGLILDMAYFASFAAIGILIRRRPQAHKRFMVLATIALLGAPIGRVFDPFVSDAGTAAWIVTALILAGMGFVDRELTGRVHPVTLWGGLLILAEPWLVDMMAPTPTWMSLGAGIMRHVHY